MNIHPMLCRREQVRACVDAELGAATDVGTVLPALIVDMRLSGVGKRVQVTPHVGVVGYQVHGAAEQRSVR